MSKHPIEDIATFMILGGQTVPNTTDPSTTVGEMDQFLARIDEELDETYNAVYTNADPKGLATEPVFYLAEAVDGLIDTAYAALTGVIRLIGEDKATKAWDAVVDANLAKVDGRHGPAIMDENGKIQKPEGWVRPDIEAIINQED